MTWASFIAQYDATGRQKGEGYFPAHFAGMSAEERDRARDMLEARARTGDTTDIDGLRLIGDDGSVAVLAEMASADASRGVPFETNRRETLFALTRDPRQLEPLLARLDDREDRDAALAAQAIARQPLPASFAGPLAGRIVDGRHEVALIWIVKAWLSAQGVAIWEVPEFDRQVAFIREVTRAAPARRAAILAAWRAAHGRETP